MHSNYNKNHNNNNNNSSSYKRQPQHHSNHYDHQIDMTDNGLHFFFNGLKLLNQKCNSPPSPTKKLLSPQLSPPLEPLELRHPCQAFAMYQAADELSNHYFNKPVQHKQQIPFQQQTHAKHRQQDPLHNMLVHGQKNSPPEMVHQNVSPHYHNNNKHHHRHAHKEQKPQQHQEVETAADLLDAIAKQKLHSLTQSSNSAQKNRKSAAVSGSAAAANVITAPYNKSEKHAQHYYSYYYNRKLEPNVIPEASPSPNLPIKHSPTRSRRIHKLPTHRMASNKTANNLNIDDDLRQEHDSNTVPSNKYLTYNANKYGNENRDVRVLQEKMPNNNIITNLYIKNNRIVTSDEYSDDDDDDGDDGDDDNWLEKRDNGDNVAVDYTDHKAYEAYDTTIQKLFNAKCKMHMRAGNDADERSLDSQAFYDAMEKAKKNLGVPNDVDARVLPRDGGKKHSPSHHKKRERDGALYIQKKLISPPPPRVLLYNNQSPRPSARHLGRASSTALRVRDFRRRTKSPSNYSGADGALAKSSQRPCCSNNNLDRNQNNPACDSNKNDNKYKQKATKIENIDNVNDNNIYDDKHSDKDSEKNSCDTDIVNDIDDGDLDDVSNFGSSTDSDFSSDSENGYRSHAYKLTHSMDKQSSNLEEVSSCLFSNSSKECLVNPDSLLMPSLFPNVPPYLSFSSHNLRGPEVPPELFRILKWRVTNVMPKVVRQVLANSGVRLLKNTNEWMGIWGKHLKSPCFKTIRPYQKINHLPGSFKIGRKDACWKNLQRQMSKHGRRDFGFMPRTFVIPNDLNMLRRSWPKYSQRNVKWIIKPPASARGAGIRVVDRWAQIPKRRPLIVQKYIEKPLLINGSKFDLRLYVLVTSVNPLRVFLYDNGLARFASVKYSEKSDTLNDRCMHLTNYSINKFSSNYAKNEDVNACHGHKWTIKSLWTYLGNRGIRTDLLWEALRSLVLRTIIAGESCINNMLKMNVESKYSCYELFGFDVILDADLIPWLLEVNISPSLHSELPLDAHVKAPLIQGVLNTVMYNVPPKLSMEKQRDIAEKMSLPPGPICFDKRLYINYLSRVEKVKHNTFSRKALEDRDQYINAILQNMTPDDVRCLIIAEDELARSAPLERIFPTNQTFKYLKFTDTPRYYNRLLDAWEHRYSNNRSEGIALLREYCDAKYHLEVPSTPAKKHPIYRPRTLNRILTQPKPKSNRTLALTTTLKSTTKKKHLHRSKMMMLSSHGLLYNKTTTEQDYNEVWLQDESEEENSVL